MRIIGKTAEGLLVSATEAEVANLTGYYSEYYMGRERKRDITVGDEIQVSAMFRQLRDLARLRGQLESARKGLEEAARMVSLVEPIIPAVTADEPRGQP